MTNRKQSDIGLNTHLRKASRWVTERSSKGLHFDLFVDYGISYVHRKHTEALLALAIEKGTVIPEGKIILLSGQAFFNDQGHVEEVRLKLLVDRSIFETETPPVCDYGVDKHGEPFAELTPFEKSRLHFSCAVMAKGKNFFHVYSYNCSFLEKEFKKLSESIYSLYYFLSSKPYYVVRDKITKREFEKSTKHEWFAADITQAGSKGFKGWATIGPMDELLNPTRAEIEKLENEERETIKAMGDSTADVLDSITCIWNTKKKTQNDFVKITADEILKMRGLEKKKGGGCLKSGEKRTGGYADKLRRSVRRDIRILSKIRVEIENLTISKNNRSRKSIAGKNRLIEIRNSYKKAKRDGTEYEYAWDIRVGKLFSRYLYKPNLEIGKMSDKILKYDSRKQRIEKRLGRYFSWIWRNRQRSANYSDPIKVKTVLENIGIPCTLKRFDEAIENLIDDGVIVADCVYVGGEPENDKQWLESSISVTPPNEIVAAYRKIKTPYRTEPEALKTPEVSGLIQRLIEYRNKKGITLSSMSEELGISTSQLSRIEKGICKPRKETIWGIRKWLESAGKK